ncbi:Marvel domain-containing protein [Strongyloides ratti]|uniref:Marvel domain-containing protein n=1 Tax=Strongyloides ratti TaxID=34506 RepID=A0A090LEF0_STRRB|nr:Marvel domain-containing protein [Strongyloides ratti]CEF68146.1 Marvel domain-containing protein [Strongyloides ratti]
MYQERTVTYGRTYQTEPRVVYSGPDLSGIHLDLDYLKTLSGMLKCIEIALCFLTFITVIGGGPYYYNGATWASFVSSVGLMITTILLIFYLFHVVDKFTNVPWIVSEMVYCFMFSMFFFLAGSALALASMQYKLSAGWAIASFFAFCAMVAYAFDCYLKFLSWKKGEKAVGGNINAQNV